MTRGGESIRESSAFPSPRPGLQLIFPRPEIIQMAGVAILVHVYPYPIVQVVGSSETLCLSAIEQSGVVTSCLLT